MADFDGDGVKDFFVGDLGEFLPADHARGAVVWLRGGTRRQVSELCVSQGWPRVADVEPADFNGDGTLDVAVAAFGWRKVGNITVLENHTTDYTSPSFVARVVDSRPGAFTRRQSDMNKDGGRTLSGCWRSSSRPSSPTSTPARRRRRSLRR